MTVNNDDATKQIFSRCLLSCLHVPLWYSSLSPCLALVSQGVGAHFKYTYCECLDVGSYIGYTC